MNFLCANVRKLTLPHKTVAQVVHWSMEKCCGIFPQPLHRTCTPNFTIHTSPRLSATQLTSTTTTNQKSGCIFEKHPLKPSCQRITESKTKTSKTPAGFMSFFDKTSLLVYSNFCRQKILIHWRCVTFTKTTAQIVYVRGKDVTRSQAHYCHFTTATHRICTC